jgi:4a-hydroxytetrahydrobiopterin dehydratase
MAWNRDGDRLVKRVQKKDFAEALAYVNAVGALAEEANHHPDILIEWNTVTLNLWTHTAGGVTPADEALAARIDELDAE